MPRLQRQFGYDRDMLVTAAYILREVRLSKLLALLIGLASCLVSRPLILLAGETPAKADVQWGKVVSVSRTSVSIQDCPEPPLRRGRPTHDPIYKALRDLHADYARLQPWFCYPKMVVAELKPPENGKTTWDFSLMDEYTTHSIFNISSILSITNRASPSI